MTETAWITLAPSGFLKDHDETWVPSAEVEHWQAEYEKFVVRHHTYVQNMAGHAYRAELEKWQQARTEHEYLTSVGMRSGDFTEPEPVAPVRQDFKTWRKSFGGERSLVAFKPGEQGATLGRESIFILVELQQPLIEFGWFATREAAAAALAKDGTPARIFYDQIVATAQARNDEVQAEWSVKVAEHVALVAAGIRTGEAARPMCIEDPWITPPMGFDEWAFHPTLSYGIFEIKPDPIIAPARPRR